MQRTGTNWGWDGGVIALVAMAVLIGAAGTASADESASPKAEVPKVTQPQTPPKNPQALDDLPSYGEALIRMVVILISMLIVLILAAKFLPRWLNKPLTTGKAGAIKVLDSLQLEPRKRLYLVQVGEQVFLVGTSEQGVQLLADRALDSSAMLDRLASETNGGDGATVTKSSTSDEAAVRSFAEVLRTNPGATSAANKTGA